MTIEVVEPGLLTSVQDAIGRGGWRHVGVPAGGAADAWSARLANRLVGNPDDVPLLEVTLLGPTVRTLDAARVALVGSLDATVDGLPMPAVTARQLRPGSVMQLTDGRDARAYLAFGGGIVVERVLGSASTDLRTGFGGVEGRALRAGDRLEVGPASRTPPRRWQGSERTGPVRILEGPHADRALIEALTHAAWQVGHQSDRAGVRLQGPGLPTSGGEIGSIGLPAGAIQVPHDGSPIVALADRPVTGGYPVPAVVIGADIGRVARLRAGDELRFASVSLAEARQALRRAEDELADLETLEAPGTDELGWAGSHG